jgi:hypothetical protein
VLSFIGLLIAVAHFLDEEWGRGCSWAAAVAWVMWLGLMLKQ